VPGYAATDRRSGLAGYDWNIIPDSWFLSDFLICTVKKTGYYHAETRRDFQQKGNALSR